ncbi:KEOPS complex subunit Pcc1 [Halopenitus persicus]|uniref:KEOPS complex subunit Pcc1 n=1 Tax=Halopenitus persicus TaxID=1048396 RepID=UPI000BBB0005|nr:KEOPS complex subunit Pcc1 [Halopenitus persicus]
MADRSTPTPDDSTSRSDSPLVHSVTLRFRYPSRDRSRAVANALAPEIDGVDDPRSRASLDRDGDTVTVRVRARDPVALRAGTNSWMRLVDVAESVAETAATDRSATRPGE